MAISTEKKLDRTSKELRYNKRRNGQKLDQVDRFRAHLLEGKKLGKRDTIKLDRLYHVFSLLCNGYTDREIVRICENAGWGKKTRVYEILRDTKKVFGDSYISNKEADKIIAIQMAKEAYKVAREERRGGDMVAATKLVSQLQGNLSQQQNLMVIYQNLQLPEINISDDPKVIDIPAEDISFEE